MRSTNYLTLYPWNRGLNTSQDPIILDSQQLQIADNVVFTTSGSRKKRGGQAHVNTIRIPTASGAQNVIFLKDYWANVSSVKRQALVSVTSVGNVYRSFNQGQTWTGLSTVALSVVQGRVTSTVFNEDFILGYSKTSPPKKWDNQSSAATGVFSNLGGAAPNGNIVQQNMNRCWIAGNAALPDRLYYSAVFSHEVWSASSSLGTTSGYIDVFPGDGDPDGITAIFPEINQGGLYVAKRTKLYFVDTTGAATTWRVKLISAGIGCVSHNSAVAVDQIDVIFASDRGLHSLGQVINDAGIIPGQYVSKDIHFDYQNIMSTSDRDAFSAVWYAPLNSYLLSCKRVGQTTFETIYGFNLDIKEWFRWTATPANFLTTIFDGTDNQQMLFAAAPNGYVNKLDQPVYNDFGLPIIMRVKSAVLYPLSEVTGQRVVPGEKHFTNIAFVFRAVDNSQFRFYYRIDDNAQMAGTIQQRVKGGNVLGVTSLGSTFILGEVAAGIKPSWAALRGVGHSIELTIEHDTLNCSTEIFGVFIEYKQASEAQNPFKNSSLAS